MAKCHTSFPLSACCTRHLAPPGTPAPRKYFIPTKIFCFAKCIKCVVFESSYRSVVDEGVQLALLDGAEPRLDGALVVAAHVGVHRGEVLQPIRDEY